MGNSSSNKTVGEKDKTKAPNAPITKQKEAESKAHIDESKESVVTTSKKPQETNSKLQIQGSAIESTGKEARDDEKTQNESVSKKLNASDAVSILSDSKGNTSLPGVVVKSDEEKEELTVYCWDLQSLDIQQKVFPFDSERVQSRQFDTEYDPWNIPMGDQELSQEQEQRIQTMISEHLHPLNQDVVASLNLKEWIQRFMKFINEKKTMTQTNPFIRLISSYLTENVKEWMDILVRYISMMSIFEAESPDEALIDRKLDILFDILNINSETIDEAALQVICIMYAKSVMPPCGPDESEDEIAARKVRINDFAGKLLEKITDYEDEIDCKEFKALIQDSSEMSDLIKTSINGVVLTDRSKITPRN